MERRLDAKNCWNQGIYVKPSFFLIANNPFYWRDGIDLIITIKHEYLLMVTFFSDNLNHVKEHYPPPPNLTIKFMENDLRLFW